MSPDRDEVITEVGPRSDRPPPRALWSTLLFPKGEERARVFTVQAWAFVVGTAFLWTLSGGSWTGFRPLSDSLLPWVWGACMIRVFTIQLGLVTLVPLLFALRTRRLYLAGASFALACLLLGPRFVEVVTPAPQMVGARLSVTSANLLWSLENPEPLARELAGAGADVLCLQEYNDAWGRCLDRVLGEAYPHRLKLPRERAFGMAVYSRIPFLEPGEDHSSAFGIPACRVRIRVRGRDVTIWNLHPYPIRNQGTLKWLWKRLPGVLAALDAETGPVVAAGDFNFPSHGPLPDSLAAIGFRDTPLVVADLLGSTWPARSWVRHLPGLRLDHVYAVE